MLELEIFVTVDPLFRSVTGGGGGGGGDIKMYPFESCSFAEFLQLSALNIHVSF